eukprot:TRINITY_DN13434_c0_g1_i2.p1 TRINITY_DN13434_c0_g1~~TRINITY_DN13434_c0_g1_i2.p1  ORF type:complete len:155 (+),score=38.12 TRINITY_DN13434_c0_g1_i2:875-1339(+)
MVREGLLEMAFILLQNYPSQPKGLLPTRTNPTLDHHHHQHHTNNHPSALKSQLTRIIANLSFHSSLSQNLVRELGGLPVLLNNCIIDDSNPFLREWSILALRNLTEGNPENQNFIASLQVQEIPRDVASEFQKLGLEVVLGPNGKVTVRKMEGL